MLIGIKYSVPSQGVLGNNLIWRIYKNINDGFTETEYVEHIDIEEGIESWTGENLFSIGFSLLCRGNLECYTDPETGLRYARIYR